MIAFLLISIGSTVGALYSGFDIFMEDHFFSPSALLIAIGIIILFVSVFGCIGAIKESVCLVKLVRNYIIHFFKISFKFIKKFKILSSMVSFWQ